MRWIVGRRIPRWLAFALVAVGFPLFHAGLPWVLSNLSTRHGWVNGGPGLWNTVGLLPIVAGFLGTVWCLHAHFTAAANDWKIEPTPHYAIPAYLPMNGPYAHSRNPIYLAELAIWLGWIVFYGSMAVLGAFCAMSVILGPVVVRREERGLEARFGEAYREYKRTVPRWLGHPRR